jgi:hypothetical protein
MKKKKKNHIPKQMLPRKAPEVGYGWAEAGPKP